MQYTVRSKIDGVVITTVENAGSESEAKARVKHRYKDKNVENIQIVKSEADK